MVESEVKARVLKWRADGLAIRLAQTALVGPLAYVLSGSGLVWAWMIVTSLIILAEGVLTRLFRPRLSEEDYEPLALAMLALSTGSFALVSVLLVASTSPVAMASAALLLSSTTLSSAMMARGWNAATLVSAGFSSVLTLLCAPIAILAFSLPLDLANLSLFEIAAGANVIFTLLITGALHREGQIVNEARARWRFLFDESPLPQVCYDASRLHERLVAGGARGEAPALDDLADLITITEMNSAFTARLGLTPSGNSADLASLGSAILPCLAEAHGGLDGHGWIAPCESALALPNGEVIEVGVHCRVLPGDPERPWADCIATLVDLTEVKAAERAQRRAAQVSEAASRAKSEFLAITSHEIRTPLNGILGMAQAMERDRMPKAQRDRLAVIRQSGDALLKILNNILDIAKIEAGGLTLDRAEFDLGGLVREIVTTYSALASQKGLEFRVDINAAIDGVCRGDPVRTRQILYNLLSNALKFTGRGWIMLSAARYGDQVVFAVADTGPGAAPEDLERLFEKFVQADSTSTRRHEGAGLGLAISRDLCRLMGGDLTARSQLGEGCEFTASVMLPPVAASIDAPATDPEPAWVSAEAGDPGPALDLRLLVAEDNQTNQLVLKTLLGQLGIEPHFADDGAAAVAAWEQGDWDLVLMDVQMPVMAGVSATRAIRRREAETGRPAVPIIALSANAMPQQIESYLEAGMNRFVPKPIDIMRLIAVMSELGEVAEPCE